MTNTQTTAATTEPVVAITRTVRIVGQYTIEEITLDGDGPFFQLRSTLTGNLLFADYGPACFVNLAAAERYAANLESR